MKILMVLDHEFPPDIRVENEIASLHNAGHEIHVACYTMKGQGAFGRKTRLHHSSQENFNSSYTNPL